jgi:hypothetical protein
MKESGQAGVIVTGKKIAASTSPGINLHSAQNQQSSVGAKAVSQGS